VTVVVVDASVLAPALADDGPDGVLARRRLRGEILLAPALVDLEVASVLRTAHRAGRLPDLRARQAMADLRALPLHRTWHRELLPRIWALRANVTAYDAAYVALAEVFKATLLTADAQLARASGPRCTIEVLAAG
jgi:predicted nucleic acid-binding protein